MFKKNKTVLPTTKTDYPSGICVCSETGYWYINGKFRNAFISKRVVDSWSFPFIPKTTEAAIAHYPKALQTLGYRTGSLVTDISDGKTYIISGKERRLITKPETYDILGIKREQAIWAAHDEIVLHPEGQEV